MHILKEYLTKNDCYKAGQKMKVQGLMIHSVGCPVEDPLRFIRSWNKSQVYKCVHAFINPYCIYETLPYHYRGWHCGAGSKGSFNNGYIGVELTEPVSIQYVGGASFIDKDPAYTKRYVKNTYKNAVEYFAYLCQKFSLNPKGRNIIVSHSEGHRLGYASNHGDVEHLWHHVKLSMEQFRKDVYQKMQEGCVPPSLSCKTEEKGKKTEKNIPFPIYREKMHINGQIKEIDTIKIQNYNYVKLDDLKKSGLQVDYKAEEKRVYIRFQ